MSKLFFDILTEEQKKSFESLRAFSRYGRLGGGTALALQFSHRRSYDFDILCTVAISKGLLLTAKSHFKKIQIMVDTSDELSLVTPIGVKVSFIFYPFKSLYKTIETAQLEVLNWKDIALDKAYTIGRRGEWRDYIDLYFCVKAGFSLQNIIQGAKRKFKGLFSEKLFLSQLCYFRDIKDYSIDIVKEDITPKQVKVFFEKEIKLLIVNRKLQI